MKKFFFIHFLIFSVFTFAQAPKKMSYQAVVRNSSNNLVASSDVGIKITITKDSADGTVVYSETHKKTTNENGLFSLEIGTGTIVNGNFDTVDWSSGSYFLTSEIDPNGSTNYTLTNSSQMLSVPYALYAEKSRNSESSSNVSFLSGTFTNVQTKILTNLSTAPYVVPANKKFLAFRGIMNAGSSTSIGGGNYTNGGSVAINIPNNNFFDDVFLNDSGTTISSTYNSNKFLGYLVDNSVFRSTTTYTVPSGKTLFILYAKNLNLDGVSLDTKFINTFDGSQPLIVNSGTVITNSFIGYLR